jgi:hypothetical protein
MPLSGAHCTSKSLEDVTKNEPQQQGISYLERDREDVERQRVG